MNNILKKQILLNTVQYILLVSMLFVYHTDASRTVWVSSVWFAATSSFCI